MRLGHALVKTRVTRDALPRHFEVDAAKFVISVLHTLAQAGDAKQSEVSTAIERYGVDPESPDPRIA
jgi:pyruvate dehydrogenase E1 component